MGKHVRIKGVLSAHRYLGSDPNDAGAQDMGLSMGGSLKYAPAHDLAIYEMQHPIKAFHGIGFDDGDLENNPESGHLRLSFQREPEARAGLLARRVQSARTPRVCLFSVMRKVACAAGASGGIVVDSKTKKIIGILSATGEGKDRIALAVPSRNCQTLSRGRIPTCKRPFFPKTCSSLRLPQTCIHATSGSAPMVFSQRSEERLR